MTNTDSYNSQKQKLFGLLNNFLRVTGLKIKSLQTIDVTV